jgi:hypothetical protein
MADLFRLIVLMPDSDLPERVVKLEALLPDADTLKRGISEVNVLKERCENIKDGLKRNDGDVDVLQKHMDDLQRDVLDLKTVRVFLYAIAGGLTLVFTVLGVTGALLFKSLNKQITGLQTEATQLKKLFDEKLEPLVKDSITRLDTHADELAATLPPVIRILNAAEQQAFVTNYYHNAQAPDPYVAKMTEEGAEFDCSGMYNVPAQARGVIIQVVIYGETENQKHVEFLCADSSGKFGRNLLIYENHTDTFHPTSGMLFCPFFQGSKKIIYRLDTKSVGYKKYTNNEKTKWTDEVTNEVVADKSIPCLGTIIGWY